MKPRGPRKASTLALVRRLSGGENVEAPTRTSPTPPTAFMETTKGGERVYGVRFSGRSLASTVKTVMEQFKVLRQFHLDLEAKEQQERLERSLVTGKKETTA